MGICAAAGFLSLEGLGEGGIGGIRGRQWGPLMTKTPLELGAGAEGDREIRNPCIQQTWRKLSLSIQSSCPVRGWVLTALLVLRGSKASRTEEGSPAVPHAAQPFTRNLLKQLLCRRERGRDPSCLLGPVQTHQRLWTAVICNKYDQVFSIWSILLE